MGTRTLSPDLPHKMDAYWRAANYLSVFDNQLYTFGVVQMSVQFSSHIRSMLNRLAHCPDGIVPLEARPRTGGHGGLRKLNSPSLRGGSHVQDQRPDSCCDGS
jgi:hypothetical protein